MEIRVMKLLQGDPAISPNVLRGEEDQETGIRIHRPAEHDVYITRTRPRSIPSLFLYAAAEKHRSPTFRNGTVQHGHWRL